MEFHERECARDGCEIAFVPKAHNGIYCSVDCRQMATNAKVLKRYYDNKDRINSTTKRVCRSKDCNTILSSYNKEPICESCKTNKLKKKLKTWGWRDDQIDKKIDSLGF